MTRAIFNELVAAHERSVFRLCRSILRDDHLGLDAAQETFLRLWRRMARGTAPEPALPWIRKAAVSAAVDLARRRRRQDDATDRLRATGRAPVDSGVRSPGEQAAGNELRARFETALARLAEGQRTVFLLRHDGGLTLAEVAESLGVKLPTVKTQFARACLRLQAALTAFNAQEETSS
jgi:RNA polymerase sigma-70 factor (ECF subfamily)